MKEFIDLNQITIRTDIRPGDIGYITYLHGVLYNREYSYNYHFERYVAISFSEFMENYEPGKDRLWIVEDENTIVGSILIIGRSGNVAQLRYFILHPDYRGMGLGKRMMQLAMDFCRSAGYGSVYLWTASELDTAAHLYQRFGFKKTKQVISNHWGKEVVEDCYDAII